MSANGLTPLDLAEQNEFEDCAAELAAWPISVVLSNAGSPAKLSACARVLRATLVVDPTATASAEGTPTQAGAGATSPVSRVSSNGTVDGGASPDGGGAAAGEGLSAEQVAQMREEEDRELARRLHEEERLQAGGRGSRMGGLAVGGVSAAAVAAAGGGGAGPDDSSGSGSGAGDGLGVSTLGTWVRRLPRTENRKSAVRMIDMRGKRDI